MIALGSSIGMGLWLGSGTSLASGGPASIFIGYLLSGTMIWSVSHSIGESTYTNGQQGNSNHVIATWSLTFAELTELLIPVLVLDIC
jgi:amino acid permease